MAPMDDHMKHDATPGGKRCPVYRRGARAPMAVQNVAVAGSCCDHHRGFELDVAGCEMSIVASAT